MSEEDENNPLYYEMMSLRAQLEAIYVSVAKGCDDSEELDMFIKDLRTEDIKMKDRMYHAFRSAHYVRKAKANTNE